MCTVHTFFLYTLWTKNAGNPGKTTLDYKLETSFALLKIQVNRPKINLTVNACL